MVSDYRLPNPALLNEWLKMSDQYTNKADHLACFASFCQLRPTKREAAAAAVAAHADIEEERPRVRGRGRGRGRGVSR